MKKTFNKYSKGFHPLEGRIISKEFIGFDCETYGEMNVFRLCSFVFNNHERVFSNRNEAIKYMYKNKRLFQGKYVVATNLQFDLIALFFGTEYWDDLKICWNESNIISAVIKFKDSNKHGYITFIDTLNFNKISVKELGQIIGIPKMEIDKNLFDKKNLSHAELNLMIEYNLNDGKISQQYMYHLQKTINELGGNIKNTAPSSALDLFRRKFQKDILIKEEKVLNDKNITEFIHKSYYGGRTENYNIGIYENTFYYDVNSLYPFSMLNDFPFPNSVVLGNKTIDEINNYMGISEVDIIAPNINIPFLPYRGKDKTIYPTGNIHGVYTHALLNEALKLGYKIECVYNQIIYKNVFKVFQDYVLTLFDIRKKLKSEGNVEEQTVKLLLNSLYGKFAQRPSKLYETITTENITAEILLKKMKQGYKINQNPSKTLYILTKESKKYPKNSFPILSSYVTSYALIEMYKLLKTCNPIYTDTDSIIITKELSNEMVGLNLGQLKLEKSGTINVQAPKCYAFNKKPTVKGIKINRSLDIEGQYNMFLAYINGEDISQRTFIKLKSGIKETKGKHPNQIVDYIKHKKINAIEDKRIFDKYGNSNPIQISDF
jgi:hypothetical protein